MSVSEAFGPYCFDSPSVTGESYKQLLTNYFLSMVAGLPPDTMFQKGGGRSHYSLGVEQLLDKKLPESWI